MARADIALHQALSDPEVAPAHEIPSELILTASRIKRLREKNARRYADRPGDSELSLQVLGSVAENSESDFKLTTPGTASATELAASGSNSAGYGSASGSDAGGVIAIGTLTAGVGVVVDSDWYGRARGQLSVPLTSHDGTRTTGIFTGTTTTGGGDTGNLSVDGDTGSPAANLNTGNASGNAACESAGPPPSASERLGAVAPPGPSWRMDSASLQGQDRAGAGRTLESMYTTPGASAAGGESATPPTELLPLPAHPLALARPASVSARGGGSVASGGVSVIVSASGALAQSQPTTTTAVNASATASAFRTKAIHADFPVNVAPMSDDSVVFLKKMSDAINVHGQEKSFRLQPAQIIGLKT